MIERGLRTPSGHALTRLAQVLGVSLPVLRGQGQVEPSGVGHPGMPAIHDALFGLGESGGGEDVDLEAARARVVQLAGRYFASPIDNYAGAAALLPAAIRDAESLRRQFRTPQEERLRRQAARVRWDTYYICRHFARSVANLEVAMIARERALRAAEETGDPEIMSAGRWSLTLQLTSDGFLDAAEEVARLNIEELERWPAAPLYLKGMMQTAASIVQVRQGDIGSARDYAEEAARISASTGQVNAFWAAFGPAAVSIYMAEIAAEHGDASEGLRIAEAVTPEMVAALPVPERRARYLTILAWLYEQQEQDAGVVQSLQRTYQAAPDEFRYSQLAQQLLARQLIKRPSREVMELAHNIGMASA
jgi:hypothetical protein